MTSQQAPTAPAFGRYLRWALLATLLPLLLLVGFNLAMQQAVVQADGTTALEPAAFKDRIRINKAFAVEQVAPAMLIVGNSRALYGYRPDHSGWRESPVYNLALAGATLYEYERYLTHAAAVRRPNLVVLSFDLVGFLSAETRRPDFSELALLTAADDARKPFPLGNRLVAALSFDQVEDNVAALFGQDERGSNRFRRDGLRQGQDFLDRAAADPDGQRGYFRGNDRRLVQGLADCRMGPPLAGPLASLRRLIDFAVGQGIPLRLVFDPVHIQRLLIYRQAGGLDSYDGIKVAVTDLAAAARARGGDVRLYDFTGVTPYTTEPPPGPGDGPPITYFYESSHFTPALGDLILDQLLGTTAAVDGFGEELTPDSVALVAARQRADLAAWTAAHPAVAQAIDALFAEACGGDQKSK